MAEIDKTYTNSYREYKEFKNWANNHHITFYDGFSVCIGDWIWDLEESDFNGEERPIMNTPQWLDTYLLQHCKFQFVLDRMSEVYSEKFISKMIQVDFTKLPSGYKRKRKVFIEKDTYTTFPLNSPYNKEVNNWWLQSDDCSYNDDSKCWSLNGDYYPHNTNTAHLKSIKAVVKHLRKQYLPKGVTFRLIGKYVGQDYIIKLI